MNAITIGEKTFRGRTLRQGFAAELSDWHEEGLGRARMEAHALIIDAMDGGYSIFLKTPLPEDIAVQYTVRSRPPWGQNNFNLISHCRPPVPERWPIVDQGRYKGYHELPNYIVTFVGDYEREDWGNDSGRGRTRVRRNPGFALNQEAHPDCRYGTDYRIGYAVKNGRLLYGINGALIHEWQDPHPLPGGFFAFRTFCTAAEYRDLLILDVSD